MAIPWGRTFRKPAVDRDRAYEAVRAAAEQDLRQAFAEYDAFVSEARAVQDGLLLGTARSREDEEIPMRLQWNSEYCHWLVQGGTGTGKTTWVSSVLGQEFAAGRPAGVVDLKGDLFETALREITALGQRLEPARGAELLRRIVVVNPFSDHLVPLNVCRSVPGSNLEVQAYEVTLALSRLFDSGLGVHQEAILRHLLILLGEAGLSLVEAPLILQDEVLRGLLASRSASEPVKEFFLGTWRAIPQPSKDALLSRLQGLLLAENVRLMLGADDLVDLRQVLDRGDPLFAFFGKGPGVPEEIVEVLGSLFCQLLFQAAYARGSDRGRPYLMAFDEFFHLLEAPGLGRRFETALTTARSFGLHLMLVQHNWAQLPPRLREIALANCDLVALFRTSARNAEFLGDVLPEAEAELVVRSRAKGEGRISREEGRRRQLELLQRLPDRHCYLYDRRKPHRAVRIRVPDRSLPPHDARLSGDGVGVLVNAGVTVAVPRAELRNQIEARRRRLAALMRPTATISRPRENERPPDRRTGRARPKLG